MLFSRSQFLRYELETFRRGLLWQLAQLHTQPTKWYSNHQTCSNQAYVKFESIVIFSLNLNFSCHKSSRIRSAIPDMTYNSFGTKYGAGILAEECHK